MSNTNSCNQFAHIQDQFNKDIYYPEHTLHYQRCIWKCIIDVFIGIKSAMLSWCLYGLVKSIQMVFSRKHSKWHFIINFMDNTQFYRVYNCRQSEKTQ